MDMVSVKIWMDAAIEGANTVILTALVILSAYVKMLPTAITDLLVENQSLRNAANGFKARAEAAEARAEKAGEGEGRGGKRP